jgi:tripartite-type tricarboxylate transporter receptor subunit TctC
MNLTRRQLLPLVGAAITAPGLPRLALALDYPSRPVHLIVGAPPGGGIDITARLIGQWLSERLGQQFVVENRPGAGTNIGTESVVRSAPDGYTLLLAATPAAINATLYEKLNFNFIRDIVPVASIVRAPLIMEVNSSFPAKTVPEFISYAKTHSGKINMASAGIGSGPHASGELFKMMTGINMIHIPYRGSAPAVTDLIGGQVQVMFDGLLSSIEFIKAGKLRALAVTTMTRSEALPDIPTLGEFVPGYEAGDWFGIGAPRNTPPEIVDKLNREINAVLANSSFKERLADMAGTVLPGSPSDFGKLIAEETEKWGKVVKFADIKAE